MAITLAGTAVVLGSIVLMEGIAKLLETIEGDPEADVTLALQQLASRNQRRALSITATEQAGIEEVNSRFSQFNEIPSRVLSEAALTRRGPSPQALDTGLLDFVSAQLGRPSSELARVSSPSRVGDMSQVHRTIGQSLSLPAPQPQGQ